jgi:hypothetical protein
MSNSLGSLYIRYKDGSGNVTERTISNIEVETNPPSLVAYCHLRNERRSFVLSRIQQAVDPANGEIIDDLYLRFDLPPPPPAKIVLPRPVTAPPRALGEGLRKLRQKEKQALWGRFKLAVIAEIYRRKLLALFSDRCFKCGAQPPLDIDHHVPLLLGGHLVPGNLVALCRPCNNAKLDRDPLTFYSEEELNRLAPLLEAQEALFNFEADYEAWNNDKEGYLVSLGMSRQEAHAVFHDPDHRFYLGPMSG